MMKTALALALSTTLLAGAAHAATFTDLPGSGYFGGTVFVGAEATITSFGTSLYFGGADSRPDSFCAISGSSCEADMEIAFNYAVDNLSFSTGGFNPGDFVAVSAFDAAEILLGTIDVFSDTFVDFRAFGSISRLFFDDSSTGAGFGYAGFSFEPASVSAVPLPAGGLLILSGLGGLAVFGRKKKKAA